MVRIAIVGAGPAGLACAQTLAATKGLDKHPQNLSVVLFDTGVSDLNQAELWCVPGVALGRQGDEWLSQARREVMHFGNVSLRADSVLSIEGEAPAIQVSTASGTESFQYVVYAAGRLGDTRITEVEYYPHPRTVKPWQAIRVDAQSRVRSGLYVAGIAAGSYSMLGSVMGSGVDVACHILSELEGHPTVVHDVKGGRGGKC